MNEPSNLAAEFLFADRQASLLSPEVQDRWHASKSGHKFQTFLNKQLIVYRLVAGVPIILNTLTCLEVKAGLRSGVATLWKTKDSEVWVGHVPVEVAESCFLWHVQHTNMDFQEYRGRFNLKVNLAYRTAVNPAALEDNQNYVLEKATFQSYKFKG